MKLLTKRIALAVASMTSAALILTACGGESQGPDNSTTDAGSETSVTVLRTNGGQFEGLLLGEEEGIWAEYGIQIHDEIGADSSAQRVPPLLNGEAQFAQIDATAMIRAAAEGLPIQIVGPVQLAPNEDYEGFEPQDGLMVSPGSDIKELQDLEGGTVGVPALGATIHIIALRELEAAGVDIDTIEFVALPAANLISATQEGQVDAVTLWGTFYGQAQSEGFTAIGPSAGESIEDIPQIVWAASNEYVAENPEAVEQFIEANAAAQDYANANPDDRRSLMSAVTELPQEYIDDVWLTPFSNNLNQEAVEELIASLDEYGFVDEAPSLDEVLWENAPVN